MSDRHFDELATRFAEKIYGGAKGAIRLAVLQADCRDPAAAPLRVLDIGAGLGHMSLWLAQQGHAVTLAEPAEPMLQGARQQFADAGQQATFIQAPWQEVETHVDGRFDSGHLPRRAGVARRAPGDPAGAAPPDRGRWLAVAGLLQPRCADLSQPAQGPLQAAQPDLCRRTAEPDPAATAGPTRTGRATRAALAGRTSSGVRVFHDYMPADFQARTEPADLIEMELAYRRHPTFAGLGRYMHWLCRPR